MSVCLPACLPACLPVCRLSACMHIHNPFICSKKPPKKNDLGPLLFNIGGFRYFFRLDFPKFESRSFFSQGKAPRLKAWENLEGL